MTSDWSPWLRDPSRLLTILSKFRWQLVMTYSVRQLLADGLRRARHIIGRADVRLDIFVGEALGYCGIWHVEAHAFSASTCSHSRRRHGYVREAIYIFRTSLSLPRARQNASLQHAGAIVASHSMHAPLASDAPLTKATLHAATFPHAGAAPFAGATLQAGNNARSTCIITIDLE